MTAPTLTEFLLARIAEDEAVARAAIDPNRPGTHWQWINYRDDTVLAAPTWEDMPVYLATVEGFATTSGVGDLPAFPLGHVEADEPRAMPHIARHDPARVLAECEARRRIVDEASELLALNEGTSVWMAAAAHARRTLRHIATVYADHPNFDEAWRA